jgi:superfamily I DNA/RNA helicase
MKRAATTDGDGDGGRPAKVRAPELSDEELVRLDALAREEFVKIPLVPGSKHVLRAPAGSGKTTLVVKLAHGVRARYPHARVKIVTFNNAAQKEGETRSEEAGSGGVSWQTIDAFLKNFYKDDVGELERTDVSVYEGVQTLVDSFLPNPEAVSRARVLKIRDDLKNAFDSGSTDGLGDLASIIFERAMVGDWWDFGTLRFRALLRDRERWEAAIGAYDLVIVDEAQDLNALMIELILMGAESRTSVFVRDPNQALYGFMQCRDITNALGDVEYKEWDLFRTFRYGPAICDYIWKRNLGARTVPGDASKNTTIEYVHMDEIIEGPHIILGRRWITLLELAWKLYRAGRAIWMCQEMIDDFRRCALSDTPTSRDSTFNRIPRDALLVILDKFNTEPRDESIEVSTVHGAKGLEYDFVRVLPEVLATNDKDNVEDMCVAYVALTRVKKHLFLPGTQRTGRTRLVN